MIGPIVRCRHFVVFAGCPRCSPLELACGPCVGMARPRPPTRSACGLSTAISPAVQGRCTTAPISPRPRPPGRPRCAGASPIRAARRRAGGARPRSARRRLHSRCAAAARRGRARRDRARSEHHATPLPGPLPEQVSGRVLIVLPDNIAIGSMAPDGAIVMADRSNVLALARHIWRCQAVSTTSSWRAACCARCASEGVSRPH